MWKSRAMYKGIARSVAFIVLFFGLYFAFSRIGHSQRQPSPVPGRAGTSVITLPNVGPGAGTIGGGSAFINSLTLDSKGRVSAATSGTPTSASTLASDYNATGTTGNTITYTPAGGAPSVRYDGAGFNTSLPGFQLQTQQTTTGGQNYWSPSLQLTANLWSGGNGWHNASVYLASTDEYASNAQNGANLSIYTRAVNNGSENILRHIFDLGRIDNNRTTSILYSGNNTQSQWGIDDGSGYVNFGAYSNVGLRLMTANTTGIYIDTSQRVIIGNSTTSAGYRLDVLGSFHVQGISTIDGNVNLATGKFITTPTSATVPPTITWTAVSYQNSWVDNGGGYTAVGYYKDPMGWVHIRGSCKTGASGTVAFTLPTGYRPAATIGFIGQTGAAGPGAYTIANTGTFTITNMTGGGVTTTAVLDGISFYAEQ